MANVTISDLTLKSPVDTDEFEGQATAGGSSFKATRATLLAIGTDTQAHSAVLDATTAAFTTADETKLTNIEALADVTSTNETSHTDVVVDGDFSVNGLLTRTGPGAYSSTPDNSAEWDISYTHSQAAHAPTDADNTATYETSHTDVVVDGDFTVNGILTRTAAGVYSSTADNSAEWDIAYTHSQASHAPIDADNTATYETSHADVLVDGDVGVSVQGYDVDTLKADVADVLTAGFAATPHNAGTKSTGTYTPDEAGGNFQYAVNGGAHTLEPPANNCTLVIQYTNNGSAGAITTSGFTLVDGDTISTTDGDDFFFCIIKCNGFSSLTVKALQ